MLQYQRLKKLNQIGLRIAWAVQISTTTVQYYPEFRQTLDNAID